MELLDLATKLVNFKSYKGHKELDECLDFCVNYFSGYPVTVNQYESNGVRSIVVQTQNTLTPDVLMLGHVDVISAPDELFTTRVENGRLYGLGSLDMKAYVATSLKAFVELLDEGFQGSIALVLVSDEETGGHFGTNYIVNTLGYRPKLVLVPDDGGHIDKIVVETKHIMQLTFNAVGTYAHACEPWLGSSAIAALMRTYTKLEDKFMQAGSNQPHLSTINLGTIQGGVATNEVPAEAAMTVDIRFPDTMSRDEAIQAIKEALAPGVSYRIDTEGYPVGIDPSHPALQLYAAELRGVTGREPKYTQSGGGTDGRYFARHNIPVITHQGHGGNCQAVDEYVEIESLHTMVQVYKQFISKFTRSV